jgi:hypothetical protein
MRDLGSYLGLVFLLSAGALGACSSDDADGGGGGGTGSTVTVGAGDPTSTTSTDATTATGTATATTGTTTTTGGGDCGAEQWVCGSWTTNGGDDATRVCVDQANAGTTNCKPAESVTLPALDENYFRCNVEPILDHKCSQLGCHGQEEGRALRTYARGRLRALGATLSDPVYCQGQASPSEECIGSVSCGCKAGHTEVEWRRNYDSARAFALDVSLAPIAAGQEDTSELIAQPIVGGKAHAGIHLFRQGDPDHTTLAAWLGGASLPSCDTGFN